MKEVSSQIYEQLSIESEFELGRRLPAGGIAHIVLFSITFLATPLFKDQKNLTLIIAFIFLVIGLSRFWLSKKQLSFYPQKRRQWVICFDSILILSASLWGTLCLISIQHYGLTSSTTSILFLNISGVCAAAATALNPSPLRAQIFVTITLCIPALKILSLKDPLSGAFAAIFLTYGIFLFLQIRGQSQVYWNLLKSKKTSELQKIEIENALQIAETAAQTKAQFLANMSHEIRTPMNGIIGMTELILNSSTDSGTVERAKVIKECGDSLLDIINDVLDFSKLEVNKIEIENHPFNLNAAVKDVIDLLSLRASEKGLILTYETNTNLPKWIESDITRFKQILTNLVSNAIKFTTIGSIKISSRYEINSSEECIIYFSIKDTGIGIAREVREKLFQSFSQVDASTTRKFGGTGLGLAISKGLCEKMGGTIEVESELGRGSTFSFSFKAKIIHDHPLANTQNRQSALDSEMGKNHPLQILIAEDNKTNQLVILGVLGKLGYFPDVATNGQEAVELAQSKKYDLILMDCHMPTLDGFEATKQILAQSMPNPPRIVALTASAMKQDVEKCKECGMQGFLGKPISIEAIIAILKDSSKTRDY